MMARLPSAVPTSFLDIEVPANIGKAPTFFNHSSFALDHPNDNGPQKIHSDLECGANFTLV